MLLAQCAVLCAVSGCGSLWPKSESETPAATIAPPNLPGKAPSQRISQFVFYSDTPIKANAPLFQELSDLRELLYRDLKLPPSNNIVQVYLFDDQDKYERFMKFRYPELPRRRAFFIAQPRVAGGTEDLLVYTYWGDHIRQDLRHELTHALLHSVLREVPLWLDEGLAEYYELPPEKSGLNAQHMEAMRTNGFRPDLTTLESFDQVQQMGRVQYQEAWAWVHMMLRSSPEAKQVLLAYLQQLRGPDRVGPLQPKLKAIMPYPEASLVQHLTHLEGPTAVPRPVVDRR
jgi:hypothetical protein